MQGLLQQENKCIVFGVVLLGLVGDIYGEHEGVRCHRFARPHDYFDEGGQGYVLNGLIMGRAEGVQRPSQGTY